MTQREGLCKMMCKMWIVYLQFYGGKPFFWRNFIQSQIHLRGEWKIFKKTETWSNTLTYYANNPPNNFYQPVKRVNGKQKTHCERKSSKKRRSKGTIYFFLNITLYHKIINEARKIVRLTILVYLCWCC